MTLDFYRLGWLLRLQLLDVFEVVIDVACKNVDYVWLGVWEENARAISFYRKNNFVEFDKHIFKLGSDEQTDIMMKLHLNK